LKIGTKFPMPIVTLGVPTQPVYHQPYVERQLTVLGWAYSFQNMPEHVPVGALLYRPPSGTFVIPAAFQIPGDTCASIPQRTLSFILTAAETLCRDGAFNINFELNPPTMAGSAVTAPLLNQSGEPKGMLSNAITASTAGATLTTSNSGSTTLMQGQTSASGGRLASTPTIMSLPS
jgi:hypothetical protein